MIDLPDIKDVGIVAEFVMWGNPWHGTVKGGVLNTGKLDETASEITRAWPQPPNAFIWLSQKDGQPDDAYSATQAEMKAAHAAAGMEFKPWALISGGQVYGQQLGSSNKWFYYAGDRVWLVTLTYPGTVTNTGSITVQISAQAWPEFTTEPHSAPIVRSVTLADIGQAAPDLSALGIAATLSVSLHDVKPNGSACILSLHTTSAIDEVVPPALGFVLVELSSVLGVFDAVAASVLKTREQTLGVVVENHSFTQFDCERVDVNGKKMDGTLYCGTLYLVRTNHDWGNRVLITDRLISAFFDEASGGIIQYSSITHTDGWGPDVPKQQSVTWEFRPASDSKTIDWVLSESAYTITDYSVTTFRHGAAAHPVINSVVPGTPQPATDTPNSINVEDISWACGTLNCEAPPADGAYYNEADLLKLRVTANLWAFPCRYANGTGPVVLIRDSLIGTPKGITPISATYLNAFEPGLGAAGSFYVAYHPKTGEVVPFLVNPVSFV